jgi:hypothetical protein
MNLDFLPIDAPLPGRKLSQRLARNGGGQPDVSNSPGSGSASSGDSIVRNQAGIAHDEADAIKRHPQLICGRLAELGTRALTAFDFSRQYRDRAVSIKAHAGSDGADPVAAAIPALLCDPGKAYRQQETRAQNLDERAALQAKIVAHGHDQLVFIWGVRIWRRLHFAPPWTMRSKASRIAA